MSISSPHPPSAFTNDTSLIDDLKNLSVVTSSSSSLLLESFEENLNSEFVNLITESPFPSPADPFEGYVNITDQNEIRNKNGTEAITAFEYLRKEPWIIYVICGAAALIVIIAILAIILWLKKNKRRVINETSDVGLSSNYHNGAQFLGCSCCCSTKPQGSMDHRQNSSSNLEFYGRPALPQSAYQAERPRSRESVTIDTIGVYIDEIEEIPNHDAPNGTKRGLPKYRYQQYQVSSKPNLQ